VCRNRTDRPDVIGTAGFEVPDGHQPACTSAVILNDFLGRVNLAFLDCSERFRATDQFDPANQLEIERKPGADKSPATDVVVGSMAVDQ